MKKIIGCFLVLFFLKMVFANQNSVCGLKRNSRIQDQRTNELIKILEEDQLDRNKPYDLIDWNRVSRRDLKRRKRVATIFAEGCFSKASDYTSASIIYQHGTTSDHYYQAFVWANKAVQLGDVNQKSIVAVTIDRYLVSVGQKQLFGTQLTRETNNSDWCLQSVEPSFSDSLRKEYLNHSLKEQIANTLKSVSSDQKPEDVNDCNLQLKPSPKGTVIGFW